jgi:lauroyl/myristoyl acyltransferase
MRMDPQAIINSRLGVGLALGLGRGVPPRMGYPVARLAANVIAGRAHWDMVQAVRANQWVVSEGKLSGEQLDQAVQDTFNNTAKSIYELYHYLHDTEALLERVEFDDRILRFIELSRTREFSAVVVGVHLCSFDLVIHAAYKRGFNGLAITLPEVEGGYRWQMEIRERTGMEIRPASVAALHEAVHRLRNGGVVLTGLDRPMQGLKYHPVFFGRPAPLPLHHVQLALKAKVPVIVASAVRRKNGSHYLVISDPIRMQPYSDREEELIENAAKVFRAAEEMILRAPQQWAMFFPVWPQVLDEIGDGQ